MRTFLLVVTILSLASSSFATEWHDLGPRSMAMGGTGAALAQGPAGAYWNPGALDQKENTSGVELPFSGHYALSGDLIKGANDVNKIVNDCNALGPNQGNCTQININNALNELNAAGSGARADLGGGAFVKIGKLGVFADDRAYVGAKAQIDMAHTSAAAGANSITNNTSALVLRGINATEFGVAYGHELPFLRGVSAGGALKGIFGKVGYYQRALVTNNSGSGGFGDFTKNARTSFQPGIDLGLHWDLSRTWDSLPFRPRVAFVARDVNDPKFKQPDLATANGEPSKMSIQGQNRLGFALSPLHFINVTGDLDLGKNHTLADGVVSQTAGLGVEVNVVNHPWFNLPLRAGLSRNLADSGSKTNLALGFGLHTFHVGLDVGVKWSPAKQQIQAIGQSKSMPSELGAGAALSVLF